MTTQTMTHLRIMGLHDDAPHTLKAIRALSAVHVDEADDLDTYQLTDEQQREKSRVKSELSRVEGLLDTLGIEEEAPPEGAQPVTPAQAMEGAAKLLPEIREVRTRLERLKEERDLLPRYKQTIEKLLPHVPEGQTVSAAVIVTDDAVIDDLRQQLDDELSSEVTVQTGQIDKQHTTLIISVTEQQRERLKRLLAEANIAQLRLPIESSESPEDALTKLETRQDLIETEITAEEETLNQLGNQHRTDLLVWRAVLQQETDLYDKLAQLGQTEHTFILNGWVPAKRLTDVRAALPDGTNLEELPIEDEKQVPIELENPTLTQPFEGLIGLLGLPRYNALDPTGLMALFLPLFFGMMLGDIGYGVVVLGLMLFLRTRFEGILRDITTIIAMGGVWAIIWGIIFGELFGTLGHQVGLHPILFDRADPAHVTDLLLLSIGVGAAHVALGLIIGVWRSIQKDEKHELMEAGGKLIGLIAALVLVGVLANVLPQALMTPAIATIIVGIVLLGISLGGRQAIISPIEFVSTLGNVISYLRIAAIGLASVYLAVVANEIAGAVGTVVVGVIIAVLLHALNIVLGMFTPTIQSLRLHYVEFFGQFYDSGGRAYQPYKPLIKELHS